MPIRRATKLTVAENQLLTRVGPGTPLGEMLRRYWHPIAPSSLLLENPVCGVTILGEELVLYKDRSGGLGLIGNRCAHLRVPLKFGIPDKHGLRCPCSSWCYDETGKCTDTPREPSNSRLKDTIKISGYPLREFGGLVFAYLGPQPAPMMPRLPFLVHANSRRQIGVTIIPLNWLQCLKNSADPVHRICLHGHFFEYQLGRKRPTEMHETGLINGEHTEWAPHNILPYRSVGSDAIRTLCNMYVPMDDERTYRVSYELYYAPEGEITPQQDVVPWFEVPLFNEKAEPIGDYVVAEDMAAWWSKGTTTDPTQECLAPLIEFLKVIEENI